MRFPLSLAMLLCAPLFSSGQPVPDQVPDESVIPQWSATFQIVQKARETAFSRFNMTESLSDEELINGKIPSLNGAHECVITRSQEFGNSAYICTFLPLGPSAVDMQNSFVRLVRLVEKATGGVAQVTVQPRVTPTSEQRQAMISNPGWKSVIDVDARWAPGDETPPGRKAMRSRLNILSRLTITIVSDPTHDYQPLSVNPAASAPSRGEIDEIIRSGRYIQLPAAQRMGSSGSGLASIRVTNETAYALSLFYDGIGIGSRTVTVPAHSTSTIQLPAGSFRVLGRVSSPNVLPFIGSETLGLGDVLATSFFIE